MDGIRKRDTELSCRKRFGDTVYFHADMTGENLNNFTVSMEHGGKAPEAFYMQGFDMQLLFLEYPFHNVTISFPDSEACYESLLFFIVIWLRNYFYYIGECSIIQI